MRALICAAIAAAAACSYNPAPVPIAGASEDLSALVGTWEGEYHGEDSGRSGYIAFSLEAERDTAYGDVLMIPPEAEIPRWKVTDEGRIETMGTSRMTQVLGIRFVSADQGRVSGSLEPYRDPRCGCRLETTFVGRVAADSVAGTFVSRHLESGRIDRGTWMARKRQR